MRELELRVKQQSVEVEKGSALRQRVTQEKAQLEIQIASMGAELQEANRRLVKKGSDQGGRDVEWLKVPYYTVFHLYIIGLRYIQNMYLKCLAPNTKQIIAASHNPLCFSPVSKVLILCLLL